MLELLELNEEAPASHGVTQRPTGAPGEEEGREPMPMPSRRKTLAVAPPSDSSVPDTGAFQGLGMKRVHWRHR